MRHEWIGEDRTGRGAKRQRDVSELERRARGFGVWTARQTDLDEREVDLRRLAGAVETFFDKTKAARQAGKTVSLSATDEIRRRPTSSHLLGRRHEAAHDGEGGR
jgi:hypothetical protein